ncbi:lanthionine synthetase LanC family protein [Ascidiimonas sp. W6]|uniref:lanthionine synthetase LanC family protein n=1 Tax=Ascidiimonas meishanensis TaxID=3128903 RepID=UPI0030EEBAC9
MRYKEIKVIQREELFNIAQNYGEALIEHIAKNAKNKWWVEASANQPSMKCDNPENIDSGNSGVLLFLVELYLFTKNKKYLDFIIEYTNILIERCENTPTDNYALYNGRSGLVFLLISIYYLTEEEVYLEKACKVLKNTSIKFLRSEHTSDFFYDGRSGVLLITYQLYCLTRKPFLLKLCKDLLHKVIDNSILTENGLSWKNKEEINIKNSCSFGYGASGIKYVLEQINQTKACESLDLIISQIANYQESCWINNYNNWGDYRKDLWSKNDFLNLKEKYKKEEFKLIPKDNLTWAFGFSGIYGSGLSNFGNSNLKIHTLITSLENYSLNLYNGVGGMGLCFSNPTQQRHILSYLKSKLLNTNVSFEGGLFHGNMGAYYTLLKTSNPSEEKNLHILFPKVNSSNSAVEIKALVLDKKEILNKLLSRKYKRTIKLLEECMPKELANFYKNMEQNACSVLESFDIFLDTKVLSNSNNSYLALLVDVINFERKRCDYATLDKPMVANYFKEHLYYLDLLKSLRNSDEWLLDQKLKISDQTKIIKTKWNWCLGDQKITDNLVLPAKDFETCIKIERDTRVTEIELNSLKIVLDQFNDFKEVKDALESVKRNSNSLLKKYNPTDKERFLGRIDYLFIENVRKLIYHKILVF